MMIIISTAMLAYKYSIKNKIKQKGDTQTQNRNPQDNIQSEILDYQLFRPSF